MNESMATILFHAVSWSIGLLFIGNTEQGGVFDNINEWNVFVRGSGDVRVIAGESRARDQDGRSSMERSSRL